MLTGLSQLEKTDDKKEGKAVGEEEEDRLQRRGRSTRDIFRTLERF